ncbi:MAG: AsmA family protein [Bryobacteraceae bacterium]|jgi:hypothetical protein
MKLRKKTIWRLALAGALLVVAVGLIAPLVDAHRFGDRVMTSLSRALGREVEIGEVHLDLFGGPGFSVDKVVIHEDPAVGLEPFAYVESLSARISFKSIFTGRLEFSSLKLEDASINLARPTGGHWNFEALLGRTAGAAAARMRLPEIEVRSGRINFKLGDTKSIFYLADARLDVIPPSSPGGEWRVRLEGAPARTDRGSQGFGQFIARGRWQPGDNGGRIDASIELARSSLSDLIRLVHGRDLGVHGQIGASARLAGPPSDVEITGQVQIRDLHRWDLLPPHGAGWPLEYRGRLDLISQTLELETVRPEDETLPVSLEFRVRDYLSQPHWAALAKLDRFPLAPLPEVARNMGQQLPEGVAVTGDLSGAVGYSPEAGVLGLLGSGETAVTIPGAPPIRLASARLLFDGDSIHLQPSQFEAGGETAVAAAEWVWRSQTLDAVITAPGLRIGGEQPDGTRLFDGVPLLDRLAKGSWKGQLEYRKQGNPAGRWTGAFQIQGASIAVPGIADPVELASARVTLGDDGLLMDRIEGRAGAIAFKGEYRYVTAAERPDQLRISMTSADTQELERLLMPSLRREESLLSRALRFGRTKSPEWLDNRRAEASLEFGSLTVAGLPLDKVHMHVRWEGTAIEATEVTAQFGAGSLTGRMSANLRGSQPAYRLSARVRGVNWMNGKWDGRGTLQAAGSGDDLLRNLRLDGSFKGRSVTLTGDTAAQAVSGSFAFSLPRGRPFLRVSDLAMTVGDASYKGTGAMGSDGRLYLEFSDGQKQMRVGATLSPFQVELLPVGGPGGR